MAVQRGPDNTRIKTILKSIYLYGVYNKEYYNNEQITVNSTQSHCIVNHRTSITQSSYNNSSCLGDGDVILTKNRIELNW